MISLERKLGNVSSNAGKYFLLSIILSMSVLGPLFQPVFGSTVIVMYHDESVNTSLKTLQDQAGPLNVIEYGSMEYFLIIHRLAGNVIWISHGSDEGILTETGLMDWSDFAKVLDLTHAADIVLACNSDNLNAFMKNPAVTFSGIIDARFGAAIAAWLLTGSTTVLSFVFETFVKLMTNELSLLPLTWGPNEQMWFFLDAAIFILQAISISFLVYWSAFDPMSAIQILIGVLYLGTVLITAASAMAGLLTGTMTPIAFLSKFLVVVMPAVLRVLFGITPWWIQAIIACETAISIGTTVKVIAVLLAILNCYLLVTGMLNDQTDRDDTYGRWSV